VFWLFLFCLKKFEQTLQRGRQNDRRFEAELTGGYGDSFGTVYALNLTTANERKNAMMKNTEVIGEAIRNPKHPFRKTEHHTKKSLKNRHERRKIREYLHLGDWLAEEAA
jgi:hypothetical protein